MGGLKKEEESITGVARPSDAELLRRAIVYAKPNVGMASRQRWACVKDVFGVGSTTATILCREAGVDPDEELTGIMCEGCPLEDETDEPMDDATRYAVLGSM
jgi:hypothetical protein